MKQQSADWRDALSALLPDIPDPSDLTDKSEQSDEVPETKYPRQRLVIQMERKGRGGKTATIISGFTLSDEEVADIAAQLKKRLGTGGSARGGEILIQGDRCDDVRKALRETGII